MSQSGVLRSREGAGHAKVGFIELFFDLVFVFAVTRLSHLQLEHQSLEGAAQTAFLLVAVWVVWMWTTWATNWLDSRASIVRVLFLVLMGAGLVMSSALPEAFGERGLVFALAYAFMHNLRNAFTVWALKDGEKRERRNFLRIQFWLVVSGVLWIAGGFAEGDMRWGLWIVALFAEIGAPWWGFRTPGMGASTTRDWTIDPGHMAERCGLFVILSLGESIIILGATFTGLPWDGAHIAAFALGFLVAISMWWIYFATAAERAEQAFENHPDAGRVARAAYTYAHIPIVAGVIIAAVAVELLLAHPTGHTEPPLIAALCAGGCCSLPATPVFRAWRSGGGRRRTLPGRWAWWGSISRAPSCRLLARARRWRRCCSSSLSGRR